MVTLRPVDAGSWRDVARLTVAAGQERFVAAPTYYLTMCAYDDVWHPMSVHDADGSVVGFLMWGIDEADGSCWLGGVLVDARHQGRGVGRAAVLEALRMLREHRGASEFALSYDPDNSVAKGLYASLGFAETGEVDEGEVVARLSTGPDAGRPGTA
ncbi:GNAT family N-acetyltransferase [Fodinibacter luteus]|uniref:GNAT family N-acetyltransferase n=1 Tax=Fodinibacter luteus TaxID=552064 RepID=A0ABP8KCI7_9MICO